MGDTDIQNIMEVREVKLLISGIFNSDLLDKRQTLLDKKNSLLHLMKMFLNDNSNPDFK